MKFILGYVAVFSIFLALNACSYSINQVHTSGVASDVVDENQSTTPSTTVSPNITLPIKAI